MAELEEILRQVGTTSEIGAGVGLVGEPLDGQRAKAQLFQCAEYNLAATLGGVVDELTRNRRTARRLAASHFRNMTGTRGFLRDATTEWGPNEACVASSGPARLVELQHRSDHDTPLRTVESLSDRNIDVRNAVNTRCVRLVALIEQVDRL